jgi:hypothetical protein
MTQTRDFSIAFSPISIASCALVLIGLVCVPTAFAQTAPPASAQSPTKPAAAASSAPKPAPAAAPTPVPSAAVPPAKPAAAQPPAAQPPAGAAPLPSTPPAGPTPEQKAEAATALTQGEAAYKAGDYASAVAHFERANTLAPSATAQYWLASSLDLKGDAPRAIVAFETLFQNPEHTKLPAEQLDPARQRLDALKQIPATIALKVQPADVQVLIDDVPQPGTSPFSFKLSPGKHKIRVQRDGYEPLETELTVAAAESLEDNVELVKIETAPPPETVKAPPPEVAPREPRSKIPAYVTLGVAGAGAVVGTIFGIQALSAQSTFEESPTASHADDVERNALIADMAFGVAFTLGITGVVLLTSDEPVDTASASTLKVAPYASKSGGGAAAHLTF